RSLYGVDPHGTHHRDLIARLVPREVVDDVIACGEAVAGRRHWPSGQRAHLGRREQAERRPRVPPRPSGRFFGVEHDICERGAPQVARNRVRGVATTDDDDVDGIDGVGALAHVGVAVTAPPVSMSTANLSGRSLARIAAASRATSYGTRMNSTGVA